MVLILCANTEMGSSLGLAQVDQLTPFDKTTAWSHFQNDLTRETDHGQKRMDKFGNVYKPLGNFSCCKQSLWGWWHASHILCI